MAKIIKNNDSIERVWGGVAIQPGLTYQCMSESEAIRFASDNYFISALSSGHAQVYNDSTIIVGAHQAISFLNSKPQTSGGIPKVATYEPEGSSATVVSHNYSDPCSWFTGSVQVVAETLTTSDSISFNMSHNRIIDMTHGRCYDEDSQMSANANKWALSVWVDGVLKLEDKWYKTLESDTEASMLRDYSVNYGTGVVTFHSTVTGTVTASYSYADKSYFSLRPSAGKTISIKTAEVQFSKGTVLQSPFVFEVFYNHPTYGWVPVPGTKISYKNAKDFISACNEGQGLIPAWAELDLDVHVFPFKYARPKPIKSSDNVEIRVYSVNNLRTLGEYATATFYITVENE